MFAYNFIYQPYTVSAYQLFFFSVPHKKVAVISIELVEIGAFACAFAYFPECNFPQAANFLN